MSPVRACVIGAGMSGLAAVDALTLAGVDVSCYEAGSDVGGMWRYQNDSGLSAAYASLRTNTSRDRMQYPSFPMRGSVPEFPHHTHMLAYLESYASARDLAHHINFSSPVEQVRPTGGEWELTAAGHEPRRFDWVVVAAGHYSHSALPALPGEFGGTVLHARDYRTPDTFAEKRVVVVGGAQSALDIAAEISTVASRTILACDQVHHLVPWRIFGRPYDELDSAAALMLPVPVVAAIMRAAMRIAGVTPDRGGLSPPRHGLFRTRWPAVVSPEVQTALAARRFVSRPRVSALAEDAVAFADGSIEPADAIIFATGYSISFPFLSGHTGRGERFEFPLYRRILSPRAKGLAFIGVVEPGPGLFEIVERQSQWLAAVISGRLPVPDDRSMWAAIDAGGERRSRRQFASTGSHTIFCNRHAYLRVLDSDLSRSRLPRALPATDPTGTPPVVARRTERPRAGRRLPAALPSARLQARMLGETAQRLAQAPASGALADLATSKYSLLVTFRRDGAPVATPVWGAVVGGRLYVRSERGSGKVRRLGREPRALLAPCTSQGRELGPPLQANGRVLEGGDAAAAERALASRYGLGRAAFERAMDVIRVDMCYLELLPQAPGPAGRR